MDRPTVHDIAREAGVSLATVDRVRADLIWLADVGLVVGSGDAAMLTERGRDVVLDRSAMPGAA